MPQEWESLLYNDNDMKGLVQNSDMKSVLTKCEVKRQMIRDERLFLFFSFHY